MKDFSHKPIVVFTPDIYFALAKKGYTPITVRPDTKNPDKLVWVFPADEEIWKIVQTFKK